MQDIWNTQPRTNGKLLVTKWQTWTQNLIPFEVTVLEFPIRLSDRQWWIRFPKTSLRHPTWLSVNSEIFFLQEILCICPRSAFTFVKYLLYVRTSPWWMMSRAKQRDVVECPFATARDPQRPPWESTHSLKLAQYTTCNKFPTSCTKIPPVPNTPPSVN